MRTKGEKVIVGFDGLGKPIFATRAEDKETRAAAEMTRRIKEEQEIIKKESEQ